jgi:hypothetical protein
MSLLLSTLLLLLLLSLRRGKLLQSELVGWLCQVGGKKKRIVAAKLFITKIQVPSYGTGFGSHHRHSPFFKHSRVWTISHVRHLILKLLSWLLLFRVWTMPAIHFWCSTSASNSTSTVTSSSGMMASFFEWETLPFTGSVRLWWRWI